MEGLVNVKFTNVIWIQVVSQYICFKRKPIEYE